MGIAYIIVIIGVSLHIIIAGNQNRNRFVELLCEDIRATKRGTGGRFQFLLQFFRKAYISGQGRNGFVVLLELIIGKPCVVEASGLPFFVFFCAFDIVFKSVY